MGGKVCVQSSLNCFISLISRNCSFQFLKSNGQCYSHVIKCVPSFTLSEKTAIYKCKPFPICLVIGHTIAALFLEKLIKEFSL